MGAKQPSGWFGGFSFYSFLNDSVSIFDPNGGVTVAHVPCLGSNDFVVVYENNSPVNLGDALDALVNRHSHCAMGIASYSPVLDSYFVLVERASKRSVRMRLCPAPNSVTEECKYEGSPY